jgi:hypothetical protein
MTAMRALTRLQLTASRSMSFTATISSKGLQRAFQTCDIGVKRNMSTRRRCRCS